ncbi:hypothetical protein LLS1_08200 [Leifsonia sp. LS1]|uniref:hypothetical protein n=1 Tax=Leifsonia sp. LS1 TaxID=2828483 RepID=UPI001CFC4DCD|nr:hypothetical protein [Leifsonia sp. LS1]GIT79151.1 hypothetical protein LLS1_08200 [Leifsonia sp. LS1]
MRIRRWRTAAAVVIAAVTLALVPATGVLGAERAAFDPGDIISDDSFFNPDAMTTGQIQSFLEARSCTPKDGVPCLADYRVDTPRIPASADRCSAIPAMKGERASSVIARVAQACTISPRVLLVLLQKEQSLLTVPSASGYQKATGYACPDTAECDKRYFGFVNQVYRAAWQFREYTVHPGDWRYRIGRNDIQFHPDASCGSSSVRIVNQATANLYNYTPYQPNDETLAAPTGPAGSCSTYGNLNFSRLYTLWFGDPTAVRYPRFMLPCLDYVGGFGCAPVPGLRG